MRVGLLIVSASAVMGMTACDGGGQTPSAGSASPGGSATNITIKNFAFTPGTVRVRTGTTVTWTNTDATVHTTTSDKVGAETWNSGSLSQNKSYAIIFTTPGTYSFHCAIHDYMTGTITVAG